MTPEAEALILEHLDLVERIAKRVAKRMPAWIDLDELVAAGNVGLCEAADRYRPELNPSFPSYAALRIYGAMVDSYRGRNYPRLMTAMPENWLHEGAGRTGEHNETGVRGSDVTLLPRALIDASPNPEEQLLAREAEELLVIEIAFAKCELTAVERKVVTQSANGKPMREIGARQKRSGAWAHYTIHRGKKKLRDQLKEYEDQAA